VSAGPGVIIVAIFAMDETDVIDEILAREDHALP
jgi:hypothetical protein